MCGVSFYCTKDAVSPAILDESLKAIIHRGPDFTGSYYTKVEQFNIGIGHNRLSILDLSEHGNQPMSLDPNLTIVFNGEIYNHQALRKQLKNKDYVFKSRTDTETILALYNEEGPVSFNKLKGMFVFVLVDKKLSRLYVVRDSLGIKPIYLYQNGTSIFGSSEIKGLKPFPAVQYDIDRNNVYEFFNNGFLYEPDTGYEHIKKLLPGTYLEFNLINGESSKIPYTSMEESPYSSSLDEKIKNAMNLQLIADAPLGVFFSGGLDSSILAAHADKSKLFFAQYEEDKSANVDLIYSKKIADYLDKEMHITDLSSYEQTSDALMESVDFVAKNSEELISDYTFWSSYHLSLAAKQEGYKVMLSGMGGDEIYAGYPRYLILLYHSLFKISRPLLKLMLRVKCFPKFMDKKFERLVEYSSEKFWPIAYSRLLGYFTRSDLRGLFHDADVLENHYEQKLRKIMLSFPPNIKGRVKFAQHLDRIGFLSHNLMVSDKSSMLASIELRVPLLDESVVAHGLSLPTKDLLKRNQLKYPLRKLLSRILPSYLVNRPKTGFNPPLEKLILNIGKVRLAKELIVIKKWINPFLIETYIEEHFSFKKNNTYKLWQLLYFSRWLQLNKTDSI